MTGTFECEGHGVVTFEGKKTGDGMGNIRFNVEKAWEKIVVSEGAAKNSGYGTSRDLRHDGFPKQWRKTKKDLWEDTTVVKEKSAGYPRGGFRGSGRRFGWMNLGHNGPDLH